MSSPRYRDPLRACKLWLDRPILLLNVVAMPVAAIYFISMLIIPWIDGQGDWNYVQSVWDRWQSLNVGLLAFISSVVAFNISRFNANAQQKRDFLASKAFLPEALSELVGYFKSTASILIQGWHTNRGQELDVDIPNLPKGYKSVFSQCIRHAEPNVGDYLTRILVCLQVHDSRLRGFVTQFNDDSYINPDRYNLITYLYRVGELQALVNKLFSFARNLEKFDSTPLDWDDLDNAYKNLDIDIDEFGIDEDMNLEAFTKRAIARYESLDTNNN